DTNGLTRELVTESPAHTSRFEDPYRNDRDPQGVSLSPFEKRKGLLLGVLVRSAECFDRLSRDSQLQKDLAIGFCVADSGADRYRTSVGDLRHQYLFDEPLVIQFGRRERPNIEPTTKHHDDICRREWIGDSPQIHGFLQQRRTHDPDQPRKASYEERGRGRSTSAPKPDRAAARRRGHWVSVRCVHLSLRGDAYRHGREHRCKSAAYAAASSACCFSHSATLVRNWPMPNV